MADSAHQQTAVTSVLSQAYKNLEELEEKTDQMNANAQQFEEGAQKLKGVMARKQQVEDLSQKFMLGLAAHGDELEALDVDGKAKLAECFADIMQQAQDDPDIGHTEEFWELAQEKLLSIVLAKEGDNEDDDDEDDIDFSKLSKDEHDFVIKEAAKQLQADAKPYRLRMAKRYLADDEIKKLEADSDSDSIDYNNVPKAACNEMYNNIPMPEEAPASASASEESEDDKDLDPETKSKMEQIKLLQNLYNAADPKFCDMDQMFKQTMSAVVDIVTPDEAQTFTFAQKQEQRCKEFMRRVNIELYACKFKKTRISSEIKSNIEYAKKDLEDRGYPVSDVETLATSNDVDGQKQLFKHSINVTLIE